MRLTKIIEFRIIAMADHYDQKCHVLILFKNKIIKKGWVFTQLESTIISLENGFSTHVSTHLSRRPVLQAAFDRVIKICRFTDVGEVLYTKFCFFSGDEFLRSDCGMVDLGSAQSDGLADLRTRRD